MNHFDQASFRRLIDVFFSDEELRILTFDLGIDYDQLEGQTKTGRIVSLIGYCQRHDLLPSLFAHCKAERSSGDWHQAYQSANEDYRIARLTRISTGYEPPATALLRQRSTLIGRLPSCDIAVIPTQTLQDKCLVSRKHAEVVFRDGKFLLNDLRSANGTRVNGILIEAPIELRSGDEICLGGDALDEGVCVFQFSLLEVGPTPLRSIQS